MNGAGYALIGLGVITFLFPTFNGLLADSANRTTGEGQILGAVFFIGGLILLNLDKMKRK
jgi:hypothetical protein